MTTFNIRDQHATTIQNVGGDMVVEGRRCSGLGELLGPAGHTLLALVSAL
jgi:hypothetical protein